jgi:hypothetical protein
MCKETTVEHYFYDDPTDEMHLRERLLGRRISHLVDDLIINHGRNSVIVSDGAFPDGVHHLLESKGKWFRIFASRPAPLRAFPPRAVS